MSKEHPFYIGHHFYTLDEFEKLMTDMGGIKEFKSIKKFMDFMDVKQCAICKVYTSLYVESAHIERPPNEAALVCKDCEEFRSNHNHTFAMQLARIFIDGFLILENSHEIILAEASKLLFESDNPNMDVLTDRIKEHYHWKAKGMTERFHQFYVELESKYDSFICKLWKLVEVQDQTHFLFCGDGFTQTTIDKVFQETRELVHWEDKEQFLNAYGLVKDIELYMRY